jgi:hypothetical protein
MEIGWPFSKSIVESVNLLEESLEDINPHLKDIFLGSVKVLSDFSNPMRFSFASHGFRELLREIFEQIAPDSEVMKSSWFEGYLDKDGNKKVKRTERAKFAIVRFLDPDLFSDDLQQRIEDLAKDIEKITQKLNSYVHINFKTLKKPLSEAESLLELTLQRYIELLEKVKTSKILFDVELQKKIEEELSEIFIWNWTFDELDTLSTHTRIEEVEFIEFIIENIDKNFIYFFGEGNVYCNLQYGSDGDVARGDGCDFDHSFPIRFKGKAESDTIEINPNNISIDTNKFYFGDSLDEEDTES